MKDFLKACVKSDLFLPIIGFALVYAIISLDYMGPPIKQVIDGGIIALIVVIAIVYVLQYMILDLQKDIIKLQDKQINAYKEKVVILESIVASQEERFAASKQYTETLEKNYEIRS